MCAFLVPSRLLRMFQCSHQENTTSKAIFLNNLYAVSFIMNILRLVNIAKPALSIARYSGNSIKNVAFVGNVNPRMLSTCCLKSQISSPLMINWNSSFYNMKIAQTPSSFSLFQRVFSSTMKKRRMKMNKHKLKKRRKALRMNTKASRA